MPPLTKGTIAMGKTSYFIIGAAIGAVVAVAINYLFGPADGTTFDANYRSRLDFARDEGQRAALAREAELRRQTRGSSLLQASNLPNLIVQRRGSTQRFQHRGLLARPVGYTTIFLCVFAPSCKKKSTGRREGTKELAGAQR